MRNERILTGAYILVILLLGGTAVYNGQLQNTYRHQVNEVSARLSAEQAVTAELQQSVTGLRAQLESTAAAAAIKQEEAQAKIINLASANTRLHKSVSELRAEASMLKADNSKLSAQVKALTVKKIEAVPVSAKVKELPKAAGGKVLSGFEVTWYNDTGKTASGRHTKDGVTVSVDPAVIPLGTWIEITFPDGTVLQRRADDTGGAVNGRIVDIYSSASTSELRQRGRTYGAKVRILKSS